MSKENSNVNQVLDDLELSSEERIFDETHTELSNGKGDDEDE